jgi:flagellar motor switch protein FliN/FliY
MTNDGGSDHGLKRLVLKELSGPEASRRLDATAGSAPHAFQDIGPAHSQKQEAGALGRIQDVPVQITAELGRVTVQLRELLQLSPGTIIELDRLAGEPVDVFVNGRLVAQGEVVTVNAKRGVRFTDIVAHDERLPGIG